MDNSIICECGNDKFWWFGGHLRCPECFNEYEKIITEYWMRRFNKEENHYSENWEHFNPALLKQAINKESEDEYSRQCKRRGVDPSLYLMKRKNKSSVEAIKSVPMLLNPYTGQWRAYWSDRWLFEDRLKRISEFKEGMKNYATYIINNP